MKINQTITYINFMQVLMTASLRLFLPLYLLSKNFRVEEIGILFAVLPLVMMVARVFLASIADVIGTRLIFRVYGLSAVAAVLTYLYASSTLFFGLGKAFEGFRQAGFWAVNRTEIYGSSEKGKEEKSASFMLGVRFFGDVVGQILIAILITYLSFYNSLLVILLISFVLLVLTFRTNNGKNEKVNLKAVMDQIFRERSREFWIVSVILAIPAIYEIGLYTGFVLPVYFSQVVGMSTFEIGVALALYSLFYAISAIASLRLNLSLGKNAVFAVVFGALPLFGFVFFSKELLFLSVAVLGVGAGMGGRVYEDAMAKLTKGSRTVSTDIGVSVVPYRVVEMGVLALFGFMVGAAMYSLVFGVVGTSMVLFVLLVYPYLKN